MTRKIAAITALTGIITGCIVVYALYSSQPPKQTRTFWLPERTGHSLRQDGKVVADIIIGYGENGTVRWKPVPPVASDPNNPQIKESDNANPTR